MQDGVVPWTMSCSLGLYGTGFNTPVTIASCAQCPTFNYCPASNASVTGVFFFPPTIVPWVMNCPVGTTPQVTTLT